MRLATVFLFTFVVLLSKTMGQDSIEFTARCPQFCATDLFNAFAQCARFHFLGCTLLPCTSAGTPGFRCGLPTPVPSHIVVRPGGEVVIDGLHVQDSFTFQVNLDASVPLETDIYLLSDATGSMRGAIASVKARFQEIVDAYSRTTNAHFGIGFFRDEAEAGLDNGFANVQALTGNRADISNAINSLQATGGGDSNEANLVALHKVATDAGIGWRKNSRKILVYFGDNPGHEPSCVGGLNLNRKLVIEKLNDKKITVVAVSFGRGLDQAPSRFGCPSGSAGTGQGTAISTGTNGAFVPSSNQNQIVATIRSAVQNLKRVYELDASDCVHLSTTSNPSFDPDGITLTPPASLVVDQTVTINSGICAAGGNFECDLKYTESCADLGPTHMKLLNIQGCP